jgi:hypothetical protein
MSLRRRILRISVTVLVILTFAGYFAFSSLLFSPLEDDYPFELASLVPRDVDYLSAKRDLAADFGTFPELELGELLQESKAGRQFLESPEWQGFLQSMNVEAALEDLRKNLESMPVELNPLDLFGGSEVLVAGYFRGADMAQSDYVALGRTNWMGKLGQSLLAYPSLLDLEAQGITVAEEAGVTALNSNNFLRPVYVARIMDVLVVGTSRELVAGAIELEAAKGQDSFGQSARYADYILNHEARADEDVEMFVDHAALMKNLNYDGNVPNADSEEFVPAFIAKLIQLKLIKEIEGVIGFNGGVALNLHADLNSELLTSAQTRFYRAAGFNRDRMYEVAQIAPRDTAILAYLQLDIGDLMRMVLGSLESAAQDNYNDLVRQVWGYPDGSALIDELSLALRDRAALIVRTNDYPDEGEAGPPNNGDRVFVWAAVGWHKDTKPLEKLRQKLIQNQGSFGIQGRTSGSSGVFTNKIEGGLIVHEFWSPLIPGTGHMAMVISNDVFIVSNHNSLIADILLTTFGDAQHPALADEPTFSTQVLLGLDSASAMVWMAPRPIIQDLRAMADQTAYSLVQINWTLENQRLSELVLKREFAGRRKEQLSDDEKERFNQLFESEQLAFEQQFRNEHVPELSAEFNRYVTYINAAKGVLLQLSLDPKRLDLAFRALIPLDDK